jgi:hypothetical protein
MKLRSLSLLFCGLLVACGGAPRKPTARTAAVERCLAVPSVAEPVHDSGASVVPGSSIVRARVLGAWRPSDPNRWKSALENYLPSVRADNQTAINTAQIAFARYLNTVHTRIHPLFTDAFPVVPR